MRELEWSLLKNEINFRNERRRYDLRRLPLQK